VDYLGLVELRLSFIQRFYDRAAEPFESMKLKIERGEEPYEPTVAPEDYDGPEYLPQWIEADDSLRVLGHCALGLVEKALHDYMREFVSREGGAGAKKRNVSWFDHYCRFIEEKTRFSWAGSPVGRSSIEQINLCRNDGVHDEAIHGTWVRQSEHHFRKHPISRFADGIDLATLVSEERGSPEFPLTLNVTRGALGDAIKDVLGFCTFLESCRSR